MNMTAAFEPPALSITVSHCSSGFIGVKFRPYILRKKLKVCKKAHNEMVF